MYEGCCTHICVNSERCCTGIKDPTVTVGVEYTLVKLVINSLVTLTGPVVKFLRDFKDLTNLVDLRSSFYRIPPQI